MTIMRNMTALAVLALGGLATAALGQPNKTIAGAQEFIRGSTAIGAFFTSWHEIDPAPFNRINPIRNYHWDGVYSVIRLTPGSGQCMTTAKGGRGFKTQLQRQSYPNMASTQWQEIEFAIDWSTVSRIEQSTKDSDFIDIYMPQGLFSLGYLSPLLRQKALVVMNGLAADCRALGRNGGN